MVKDLAMLLEEKLLLTWLTIWNECTIGSLEVTGALKYLIILKASLDLGNNEKLEDPEAPLKFFTLSKS